MAELIQAMISFALVVRQLFLDKGRVMVSTPAELPQRPHLRTPDE
jgi:hypothetical protein